MERISKYPCTVIVCVLVTGVVVAQARYLQRELNTVVTDFSKSLEQPNTPSVPGRLVREGNELFFEVLTPEGYTRYHMHRHSPNAVDRPNAPEPRPRHIVAEWGDTSA